MLLTALSVCAKELDAIKAEGELSFALTGQYLSFNFVDENNQVTGFDIEEGTTAEMFSNPQNDRTQKFLADVAHG